MRLPHHIRLWLITPLMLTGVWWFGRRALRLHAQDQFCLSFAGPWLPCGPGPDAWHLPAILAALCFIALVSIWLPSTVRLFKQRMNTQV